MPNCQKLPSQSKHFNGRLYQRMLEDLHLAGEADRTIYGYIRAVRQLAEFSQLAPDEIIRRTSAQVVVISEGRSTTSLRYSASCFLRDQIAQASNRQSQLVAIAAASWNCWRSPTSKAASSGAGHWSTWQREDSMMLLRVSKTRNFQSVSASLAKNVCAATAESTSNNRISDHSTTKASVRKHQQQTTLPVSYTHLTLPTICSV